MECNVVQIVTPEKLVMNGLWFGPKMAQRVIIFIHGLSSNAFSGHDIVCPLIDESTAVLTFSNRGNGKIVRMKRVDKRKRRGYSTAIKGESHEVFTECIDDLQGVIDFVSVRGGKEIYLVGSSTGCQKSIYYLSQRGKQSKVKGVILLSPMSDYAGALYQDKNNILKSATELANNYVKDGTPHKLLPLTIWPLLHDAQRFLSLFTPDSSEEIFCYCQENKIPTRYQLVKIPQLILLGEKDESRDRNMKKIAQWFEANCKSKKKNIYIIKNAPHSFFQHENEVSDHIKVFIGNNSL